MSIYVKSSEGVTTIQDLNARVTALEDYQAASGRDIATATSSNIDIRYLYFKRYGKVVTVFGRVGIGSFPGTWNSKKIATITSSAWKPRTEGCNFPVSNQNGVCFDMTIGTDGVITFNQRGVSSPSDTWLCGSVVYIVN